MSESKTSQFVEEKKGLQTIPSSKKRRKIIFPFPLLDEKTLLQAFKDEGIAESHAYTIWRHVIQKGITNVMDISGLPKKAYTLIQQRFVLCTSKLKERKDSKDGSTTKLLITLQDGRSIEAVIMRYGAVELSSFPEERLEIQRSASRPFKSNCRSTLCVSSQVGCQMGCTFCATGTMGLLANLTAGEILEQLHLASQIEKIRNIVFMGMGEPLDNYAEVVLSLRGMMDVRRFNLSCHRITVSTVGIVPRIKQLANEFPGISLALSLHAPTQALRLKIVPSAKAWSVDKLMEAIDFYVAKQKMSTATMQRNQFVMIEYVLIADVNDSPATAHDLGALLQPRCQRVLLNVIPYNPTNVPMNYRSPSQNSIDTFVDIVRSCNVKVTIRQELGTDISGACGQLVIENNMLKPSLEAIEVANFAPNAMEIEDIPFLLSTSDEQRIAFNNSTAVTSVSSCSNAMNGTRLPSCLSAARSNNISMEEKHLLNVAASEDYSNNFSHISEHLNVSFFQRIYTCISNLGQNYIRDSHVRISCVISAIAIGIFIYSKRQ